MIYTSKRYKNPLIHILAETHTDISKYISQTFKYHNQPYHISHPHNISCNTLPISYQAIHFTIHHIYELINISQ